MAVQTRGPIPWEELAARVDIVEIIGEHVHLRRAGKDWVGLCPFHSERTPSFTVSPDKQFFYCFGCQAGGDVYTFLMKQRGLTFREAAEEVARRAGVDLSAYGYGEQERQQWENRRRILAACQAAADLFQKALALPSAEPARVYLRRRGLGAEIVEAFGLGFAPDDAGFLREGLQQKGISDAVAREAGLWVVRTRGSRGRGAEREDGPEGDGPAAEPLLIPRFRGRLMFPIRDVRGQVVGFGGRKLSEEAWGPKYLNSPQTPVFNKGQVLFGLWEARDAIRRAGYAILVEGYMDVLSLHQGGIQGAVASLGTALTPAQAALLQRYCQDVIVAFDGDGAGERAALRSLTTLSEAGLRVRVLVLPRGHDPDTWVRDQGADAFRQALEQALPLTEFRLRMALRGKKTDTVEDRARAVEAVLPVLAQVASAVELEGYIKRLAKALEVSEEALRADLEAYLRREARLGRGNSLLQGRHRLAETRHNNRGFVRADGEQTDGAGAHHRDSRLHGSRRARSEAPGEVPRGRGGSGLRDPLAAVRRAEALVLRQMMEGPREALALWNLLEGAGFRDEVMEATAQKLVERAQAVSGSSAGDFLAPTGEARVDSLLERLKDRRAPGPEAARAWVRWLHEYGLRQRLVSIEGRLQTEAECARSDRAPESIGRLIQLIMEYHGVRLQAVAMARRMHEGHRERLEP